jgi:NTE family protein
MLALDKLKKREGTALVLSGGATKAFYFHLGVLKALHLNNISSIVGSSAGAFMGALIASGISVEQLLDSVAKKKIYLPEIHEWVNSVTSSMLFRPKYKSLVGQSLYTSYQGLRLVTGLPRLLRKDILAEFLDTLVDSQTKASSFFSTTTLEKTLNGLLSTNDFRDLKTDLYVVATDIDSGRRVVFNSRYQFIDGENRFITDIPIQKAVRASAAVPGLFEPVKIGGRYYVDGEIKRTLSADIGIHLADTVIVSHTYQPLERPENRSIKNLGWFNIVKQSAYIVFHERIRVWEQLYQQQFPDKHLICIAPDPDDEAFFLAPQFSFRAEVQKLLIESGEKAARHALEKYSLSSKAV